MPFHGLFKLPTLVADVACLGMLWATLRPPLGQSPVGPKETTVWIAMAVFACNPISILVTAFHGNTDSLCAMFGLAATALHSRDRFALAGLALAGAVNVKVVGLMWSPALFFLCPSPKKALRFVAGFCAGLLPFLGPLLCVSEAFYRNAIAYNSVVNLWGVNVLSIKLWDAVPALARRTFAYLEWGRYVIIDSIILGALWARRARLNPFESASASMALFLTLTPGFGVQYLVWVVPILAVASI